MYYLLVIRPTLFYLLLLHRGGYRYY